jgi:hypothetical protein
MCDIEWIFLFGLGYHLWRGTGAGKGIYRCPIFNNKDIWSFLALTSTDLLFLSDISSQNVIWVHKIDFTPKNYQFQCHTGQKWDILVSKMVQNGPKNDSDPLYIPKWVLIALSGQFAWVLMNYLPNRNSYLQPIQVSFKEMVQNKDINCVPTNMLPVQRESF